MDRANVLSGADHIPYAARGSDDSPMNLTPSTIFTTIPPERVGLNGEYDHSGLAKRVRLAYETQFEPAEICNLQISQRGAVVILVGEVSNQRLLTKLVNAAMAVEGTVSVEINGVSIFQPCKFRFSENAPSLNLSSYAF
jgi:hypothetical protein